MTSPGASTEVLDAVRTAVDSTTAGRVFGEPVIADGVVLLPVARVAGGGGGGAGSDSEGRPPEGAGGGFGTYGRGLGVFVVKDGRVVWRPAIDVNRIVLGGQIVAVVAMLTLRAMVRAYSAAGGRPNAGRVRRGCSRAGRIGARR